MKHNILVPLVLLFITLLTFCLAGCRRSEEDPTPTPKTLTIPAATTSITEVTVLTPTATTLILETPTPKPEPEPTETVTPQGLRFVDAGGQPISGKMIRIICYESNDLEAGDDTFDVETKANGEPDQWRTSCNYIAALWLVHEQSSDKPGRALPAYRIYRTSWGTGLTHPIDIADPNNLVITISNEQLILFDVEVSLAWEPTPTSPNFLEELQIGISEASKYLSDLTDGRMAFGNIRVSVDGENWSSADIRFLPANDYRPTAYVGGMANVDRQPPYLSPAGHSIHFAPGAIFVGRAWNGNYPGAWAESNGYRTLIHEWAHYALFLYDAYIGPLGEARYDSGNLITCTAETLDHRTRGVSSETSNDMASAMAWHYSATELWLRGESENQDAPCLVTQQWYVHGMSDWETLTQWLIIQDVTGQEPLVPPATHQAIRADEPPGPASRLPDYYPITQRNESHAEREMSISASIPIPPRGIEMANNVTAQVYSLRGNYKSPTQIHYQGSTLLEFLDEDPSDSEDQFFGLYETGNDHPFRFLGLDNDDKNAHARVFVDHYRTQEVDSTQATYAFEEPTTKWQSSSLELEPSAWQPSLDVDFSLTDGDSIAEMTVSLTTTAPLDDPPQAQFCLPDQRIGCVYQGMTGEDTEWKAVFRTPQSLNKFPLYSIVRVLTILPDGESTGEVIRWVQVGGGVGPAHNEGHAPLLDSVLVNSEAPTCNARLAFMPAASYEAVVTPLVAADFGGSEIGIIGVPFDIDVINASGDCLRNGDEPRGYLTLPYDDRSFEVEQIDERQLRMLHFTPTSGWVDITPSPADSFRFGDYNLLTAPIGEDGIYAVAWVR
jgi:hypothetical protein